jgi:hypothetical protein
MSDTRRELLPPTVEEKKWLKRLLARERQLCVHCLSPRYFHNVKLHIAKAHKEVKAGNVVVTTEAVTDDLWDHG